MRTSAPHKVTSSRRTILVNYAGSAWTAIMAVAFVPAYIHYLGIEAYALVGIFTVVQSWAILLDAGITPTLTREMARFTAGSHTPQTIRDLAYTVELLYLAVIGVAVVAMVLAAPWLASHWVHPQKLSLLTVTRALQIIGLVAGLRWLSGLYRGAFIGLQKQIWLNAVTGSFATARGLGVVGILAWVSPTINAFFLFQGLMVAGEVLVLAISMRRALPSPPLPAQFTLSRLGDVWRFAAGMWVLAALGLMLTQFDKLVLSNVLPLTEFGYYAVASTVANGLYVVLTPITNVSYPRFTDCVARGDTFQLASIYHRFAQLTAMIVVPAAVVLAFFSKHVLFIWTGNAALANAVAPLLSLLAIGNMLHGLMNSSYTVQLAYGRTSLYVLTNSIAAAVLLPILYVSVHRYGAIAAPIVWIVLNVFYVAIVTPLIHRQVLQSEMGKWYRDDVAAPVIAAVLSVGSVWAFSPAASLDKPLTLCITLGLATMLGLGATAMSVQVGREEITTRLREGLQKVVS